MELHYGKEGFPLNHRSRTKSAPEKPFPIKTKWKENTKQSLKKCVLPDSNCFLADSIYSWKHNSCLPLDKKIL